MSKKRGLSATFFTTIVVLLAIYPLRPSAADSGQPTEICPPAGLVIPPKVPNQIPGDVPGWKNQGGGMLVYGSPSFSYSFTASGKSTCMSLVQIQKDQTRVILDSVDVSKLSPGRPGTQLSYCVPLRKDGKIDYDNDEKILGFTLAAKDRETEACNHYSRRILAAWKPDFKTGKFVPVAPVGLICDRPDDGVSCYHCKYPKPNQVCSPR